MSQGRHGIKVLGLSLLAALGLMAFTAAAAQAGSFTIEGKAITASETIGGTVAAGKLLVPGLGVTFVCTSGKATGTIKTGGLATAAVLYSGCEVEGNKFCKLYETKAKMETELEADRGFISAEGSGEIILMGGKHYLLISSANFATLYLTKSTKGCTLPLENTVNGSTVLYAPTALTPSVNQTLETIPQAELEALFPNDKLFYGTQAAWLDGGTATGSLTGVNKGKTWGGE